MNYVSKNNSWLLTFSFKAVNQNLFVNDAADICIFFIINLHRTW